MSDLSWTDFRLAARVGAIVNRLHPVGVELWVTGTVSPLARKALAASKLVVREGVGRELLGELME